MTFRTAGGHVELEFVPGPGAAPFVFRGSLHEDGTFEMNWEEDIPGFSNARSALEGRFAGNGFTATETTEIDFVDPELIEIFGTDHCNTVLRWEGERIQS